MNYNFVGQMLNKFKQHSVNMYIIVNCYLLQLENHTLILVIFQNQLSKQHHALLDTCQG